MRYPKGGRIDATAPSLRRLSDKELTHERLGDAFASAQNDYDTRRRVQVVVDEFLTDQMVLGKHALDVGCGLGHFSRRLRQRGAQVTATDIGPGLVEKTRRFSGCRAEVADALALVDRFGPDRFDLVVSSECIEHTPEPSAALQQMAAVLRPGGFLALSTPNLLWLPMVKLATRLRMRPFDGHEHFSTWGSIRAVLKRCGVDVQRELGLHLFPFQLRMHRFSTWCDRRLQFARGVMINIAILGRKQ